MRSAPRLTMVEGVIFLDDVLERAERHIVKDGDWASLNKAEHEGHLRNGCVHDPNMLFKLFKQGALTGKQVYPYKAILVMGRDDHEIVVERSLTLEEVRHRARETKDD
ncbi:MAG: hypothetical protein Q8P35_03100 [Candidatus Yanofskybacteria bacterium]|nr:hypothetical protein [Candidatus Yanofskybacteria bacterium]